VFRIRIVFNTDPHPALASYVSTDPDPKLDPDFGIRSSILHNRNEIVNTEKQSWSNFKSFSFFTLLFFGCHFESPGSGSGIRIPNTSPDPGKPYQFGST